MNFLKTMRFVPLLLAMVLVLNGCGLRTEEHEYAEYFTAECKALEKLSKEGFDSIDNEIWLSGYLYQYQVQPDGYGLAITLHPDGLDASGTTYAVMYETSDGGKNWNLLHDRFTFDRGHNVLVYMDEIAVLAADCSKGCGGSLKISYDRGHTWSEGILFDELIDYDPCYCENLDPYVINYNEHTGIITFGWKDGYNHESDEYVLINQFDANACEFVEEVYRSPDFLRAS